VPAAAARAALPAGAAAGLPTPEQAAAALARFQTLRAQAQTQLASARLTVGAARAQVAEASTARAAAEAAAALAAGPALLLKKSAGNSDGGFAPVVEVEGGARVAFEPSTGVVQGVKLPAGQGQVIFDAAERRTVWVPDKQSAANKVATVVDDGGTGTGSGMEGTAAAAATGAVAAITEQVIFDETSGGATSIYYNALTKVTTAVNFAAAGGEGGGGNGSDTGDTTVQVQAEASLSLRASAVVVQVPGGDTATGGLVQAEVRRGCPLRVPCST
jgi:hypothetical protein